MMDENSLESSMTTYRQQLQQVNTVLQSAGTEGQEELLQLKRDLEEVIQLTEESLLSLKKSKLLSFVEGTGTSDGKETSEKSNSSSSGVLSMDEEYEAFKVPLKRKQFTRNMCMKGNFTTSSMKDTPKFSEGQKIKVVVFRNDMMLAEDLKDKDEKASKASCHVPLCQQDLKMTIQVDGNRNDNEDDDSEEDDDTDKTDLELQEEVAGTKCSLMYSQQWGAKERHNAIILELEPKTDLSDEVFVRVLFCNPTHQSMRPCPFFLDGKCKFSTDACRFSHGHVVSLSELAEYQEPDLRSLEVGSKCLARYDKDQLWYPAEVDKIDVEFQKFKVKFESYGNEAVLAPNEILPRASHVELSSDEDDGEDIVDASEEDMNVPCTSKGPLKRSHSESEDMPTEAWKITPGVLLGQWEEHTRGIGSRLMAKMGYEYGQGLGKHNQGRVDIVEAVVLPPGKSLDKCMQMKEAKKCHIVGEKKKKSKGKTAVNVTNNSVKKKKKDVFAFINNQLKGRKAKISELLHQNIELVKTDKRLLGSAKAEPSSGRKINIQLVKTQEEIINTKKEIIRLRESLNRHERDKKTTQCIEFKIAEKEKYLESLAASEKKLERQQATRNHHRKLTVF